MEESSEGNRAEFRGFTLRADYWDNRVARAEFCAFMRDVFALDFTEWEAAGYWDEDYRPFSLFDATGRVVANACLYTMQLVVAGERVQAAQLSAVATRPAFRRRGLARVLGETALAWADGTGHAFGYLFANEEAFALYRQLGFAPVAEHVTTVRIAGGRRRPGARRVDPRDPADQPWLYRHACARAPVSRELGVLNERLWMFHALGPLRDAVWHVPELEVVVLAHRAGGVLTLYDVVGPRVPHLAELYSFLADPGDTTILIRFHPDQLGNLSAVGAVGTRELAGNNLHVRGTLPLVAPLAFPITAQA